MKCDTARLRQIPKIDEILKQPVIQTAGQQIQRSLLMESIHETVENIRQAILAGDDASVDMDFICSEVLLACKQKNTMSLRPVINATGIILHTNLGRAKLSDAAVQAITNIAQDYNTLEYNLAKGTRGSRYDHVVSLLSKLTGAEDALVVNNNAAAVMLILSTMVKGKEAIVSRGELVEIGGAFRVPDIMEESGGTLVEVGTTNKTHPSDYLRAISENTGAFLKVHTSNFKIVGFSEEVPLTELVQMGQEHHIPVIYDLGSGAMVRLEDYGILDEPNVLDSVKSGADIVSFSGDKLMGGPQAGIIVGKKEYIAAMKKNPLTRAFRIDKLTLAALEATLRQYLDIEDAVQNIPTLQMLSATVQTLTPKGQRLFDLVNQPNDDYTATLCEDVGQVGGGSVPTQLIRSVVVAVRPTHITLEELEIRLRRCDFPIISRISKDRILFDVRTIEEDQFHYVAQSIRECCK